MKRLLFDEIAKPVFRRLGTALGAFLIGYGATSDQSAQIVAGFIALMGLAADLLFSFWDRR